MCFEVMLECMQAKVEEIESQKDLKLHFLSPSLKSPPTSHHNMYIIVETRGTSLSFEACFIGLNTKGQSIPSPRGSNSRGGKLMLQIKFTSYLSYLETLLSIQAYASVSDD
jgi:hypothetical protein